MRKTLLLLLCLLGLLLAAQAQEGWREYTNARFGFTLNYPAGLRGSREPDNGGGREFHTADKEFSVAALGRFLADDESLDRLYREELATLGKSVTYKKKAGTWYVVSGVTAEGMEFYRKVHVQGSNLAAFEITYPHAKNKQYDPWVTRIEKSFVPFLKGDYDRVQQ